MIRVLLFITFPFILSFYGSINATMFSDHLIDIPDLYRNVSELITSNKYPLEEHVVQTADGYLLSVQRIPHGRNNSKKKDKKDSVLIIHGIIVDASSWLLNLPNQSLGFILPDNGFDVWLLNTRGNRYSQNHVTYKTDEYRFWNFSFDQLAQYDVPDTIDYILNATGNKDLYIIAHSQGTTATFSMLSEKPDYNDKVKLFCALSPVITLGYFTSSVRALVPIADIIGILFEILTAGALIPKNFPRNTVGELCNVIPDFCKAVILSVAGADSGQFNKSRMGVYVSHYLSGTSVQSAIHYAQLVKPKRYTKFDYGPRLNLEYYHQEEPPEYDPSSITAKVALFWSKADIAADLVDVDILRNKLNRNILVYDYCVPYPYNHVDFQLAKNAAIVLYKPILQLLAGESPENLPTGCK